ncbi:type VII secretion target [Actinophytocola xanthii]|uniref:Excreted virulence factor EspC, type VII ESX diderm n=1 Tax=Actinophytocola xanthii TaxID=1912961 RepID=A0A1Q8CPB1_9PSEU|nr:type VII secretion target [Actinophytocola xanthii]OLF16202.1 hypothetical protein BU204_17665 [Actinophytocola xanthii]
MSDGYTVEIDQLRRHASNLDALRERFAAVKAASAHISQDDQAYGLLCGWISGVLEGRHRKQDELIAYVEENLGLAATSLRDSADAYEELDAGVVDTMGAIENDLGEGGTR